MISGLRVRMDPTDEMVIIVKIHVRPVLEK
jgi:hypothetical protein